MYLDSGECEDHLGADEALPADLLAEIKTRADQKKPFAASNCKAAGESK